MRLIILLSLLIVAVAAGPRKSRIVGGSVTTINKWPSQANIMHSNNNGVTFSQGCGGTIINNRSIMTAAHCAMGQNYFYPPNLIRLRLGSSMASSGGVVHNVQQHIFHPNYNVFTLNSDIMIMRSATNFIYSNVLQQASIASSNYNLQDNQVVWVTGWGAQWFQGPPSEQLREVQVWTINQNVCAQRYGGGQILSNMLCTGWLDVGGRDACQGDSGGPVYHNNVVVGVTSFGYQCAHPNYPGVNARVSSFTSWIQNNA